MSYPKKNLLILAAITLLGLALRFWRLSDFPVSLNWDEVSHGYNAYSILLTGRDEWGQILPAIFRAFGDYKLPVYIYLTVIPVFLFGLNAFSVRFISALAGAIAIPLIYLLAGELFQPKKNAPPLVGLLAAFLLAISPWHFFISHPALEANLSLTLIIAGAYFLLRGRQNSKFFIPAAILFSLSLHTYNTARVFVPLLLFFFFLLYRRTIKIDAKVIVSGLIFALSLALVIYQVAVGTGTARYEKIAILSETAVFQIGQSRERSRLPALFARLVYNRPVYFSTTFVKNYLSYFSPTFFNQSHGAQTQFAVPGQNLFTAPVLLLALVGLLFANRFLWLWLLLSPLAAAATIDPPQALRPSLMIPAVILLAALGLASLKTKFKTPIIVFFLALSALLFASYLKIYYTDYQKGYSASWQYGYRQAIAVINENFDKYDRIIMTKRYGEPHIFYAFYSRLDPKLLFPGPNNIRYPKSNWFWTDKIGKVYFVNDWQIPTKETHILPLESGGTVSTNNSLLITSPDHVPANTTEIERIDFLNGDPAFVIAKFN